jgi:3-hydroxy acid dehydrogenase/malonic semialdehyde reductase
MNQQETVVVTGASSGIGEAVVRAFAARGAALVLVARRRERLEALARGLGVPVHVAAADVRDSDEVRAALSDMPEPFAAVTVLVNGAGLALGQEPAHTSQLGDWHTMVDTNVKGLLNVTHALLPGMAARRRGHVINLGSVAGTYPYPGGHVYGGTKAFVHQFSLALRSDLQGTGVRVTCIEPGMVETDFSAVRFKGDEARAAAVYQGADPLTPGDIAEAVVWCASQPARVNVNSLELMPVRQAFSPFAIHRTTPST